MSKNKEKKDKKKYVLLEGGIIREFNGRTFSNWDGSYCMMIEEYWETPNGTIKVPCNRKIIKVSENLKDLEETKKREEKNGNSGDFEGNTEKA